LVLRRAEGMKIKLVFQRTESDNVQLAWVGTKIVEVEVPDYLLQRTQYNPPYVLTGMVDELGLEE